MESSKEKAVKRRKQWKKR